MEQNNKIGDVYIKCSCGKIGNQVLECKECKKT